MPLVLTKTMSGLDYVRLGRSAHFSGSLLLLHIWLMVVTRPVVGRYRASCLSRAVIVEFGCVEA